MTSENPPPFDYLQRQNFIEQTSTLSTRVPLLCVTLYSISRLHRLNSLLS